MCVFSGGCEFAKKERTSQMDVLCPRYRVQNAVNEKEKAYQELLNVW